jgi:histidinol-phosphatase (PHP family)
MRVDTHMHSLFSCDGKASLEEMCLSAIKKGLTVICFTEHFDMNPKDDGLGFFKYDEYSDAIKRVQDKYSGQITVLKGLEFSEPHL